MARFAARILTTWVLVGWALAAGGCTNPCDSLKQELETRICDQMSGPKKSACLEGLVQYDDMPTEACRAHLEALDKGR